MAANTPVLLPLSVSGLIPATDVLSLSASFTTITERHTNATAMIVTVDSNQMLPWYAALALTISRCFLKAERPHVSVDLYVYFFCMFILAKPSICTCT